MAQLSLTRSRASLLVAIAFLSGCAGGVHQEDNYQNPYFTEIVELSESTDNAFVQSVSADGELTEDEYAQIQVHYADCMHASGLPEFEILHNEVTGQPIYQNPTSSKDLTGEFTACAEEVGLVEFETLYSSISANPNKADINELWARCLREIEAVGDDFRAQDMREAHTNQTDLTLGAADPAEVDNCLASPYQTLKHLGQG